MFALERRRLSGRQAVHGRIAWSSLALTVLRVGLVCLLGCGAVEPNCDDAQVTRSRGALPVCIRAWYPQRSGTGHLSGWDSRCLRVSERWSAPDRRAFDRKHIAASATLAGTTRDPYPDGNRSQLAIGAKRGRRRKAPAFWRYVAPGHPDRRWSMHRRWATLKGYAQSQRCPENRPRSRDPPIAIQQTKNLRACSWTPRRAHSSTM